MRKMKSKNRLLTAVVAGVAAGTMSAHAVLLSYMPFDGGSVGQTLADTVASGPGAIGFTSTFTSLHSASTQTYIPGMTGSLGGSGNAMAMTYGRHRMIIDRMTTDFQNSGLLDALDDPNTTIGADGTAIWGSVLISNPNGVPVGYTGLEFAIGDPNSNRKIVVGEAQADNTDALWVDGGGAPNLLALPPASAATREIVFRIDFGAGNADTVTLINPDGTDGATSGTRDMSFSTLHLANYTSSYAVNYDEIRLGTTLADVSAIPEPATLGLVALFGGGVLFLRRLLFI